MQIAAGQYGLGRLVSVVDRPDVNGNCPLGQADTIEARATRGSCAPAHPPLWTVSRRRNQGKNFARFEEPRGAIHMTPPIAGA
jgi:hypothetical protein